MAQFSRCAASQGGSFHCKGRRGRQKKSQIFRSFTAAQLFAVYIYIYWEHECMTELWRWSLWRLYIVTLCPNSGPKRRMHGATSAPLRQSGKYTTCALAVTRAKWGMHHLRRTCCDSGKVGNALEPCSYRPKTYTKYSFRFAPIKLVYHILSHHASHIRIAKVKP